MPKTIYHAVPAVRCPCPAMAFGNARDAREYARRAANAFRVAYAVWRVGKRTLRLLKRYPPAHVRVGA
jgi:hypothetical protein